MTNADFGMLVETDWLETHLNDPDLRILDCTMTYSAAEGKLRFDSGRDVWAEAHIPGSDFVDVLGELSDPDSPLTFQMPPADRFAEAMSRHGVGDGTRVLLYDGSGTLWATRVAEPSDRPVRRAPPSRRDGRPRGRPGRDRGRRELRGVGHARGATRRVRRDGPSPGAGTSLPASTCPIATCSIRRAAPTCRSSRFETSSGRPAPTAASPSSPTAGWDRRLQRRLRPEVAGPRPGRGLRRLAGGVVGRSRLPMETGS